MGFVDKLMVAIERQQSLLCVGLDPVIDALPEGIDRTPDGILAFNRAIIEATADLVCAYKPNLAFYEALGGEGWRVLEETVRSVPPHIPVIADAKRADIGNTAAAYATAIFDRLGCDACTVNPYLGSDGIEPFVTRPDAFAFVLCRTSNPGARDLQDLLVDGEPLYVHVARMIQAKGRSRTYGLVVGATDPAAAVRIAASARGLWYLAPGLGAQGGDLAAMVAALGSQARRTVWNVSRGIAGAGTGRDYAQKAREAAQAIRTAINHELMKTGGLGV